MAICLNCNKSISWDARSCGHCNADYGPASGWHPLPQSEEEEARQLEQGYFAEKVPAASAMPKGWRVTAVDDGLRLVHAPSVLLEVGVLLGITIPLAIFLGVATFVSVESTTEDAIKMFIGTLLLPVTILPFFMVPMVRGGLICNIFPTGLVAMYGRWRKRIVELGTPISVMVEPLDSTNVHVLPHPDCNERLVLRGPRDMMVITYAPREQLLQLRDELRRRLKLLESKGPWS